MLYFLIAVVLLEYWIYRNERIIIKRDLSIYSEMNDSLEAENKILTYENADLQLKLSQERNRTSGLKFYKKRGCKR